MLKYYANLIIVVKVNDRDLVQCAQLANVSVYMFINLHVCLCALVRMTLQLLAAGCVSVLGLACVCVRLTRSLACCVLYPSSPHRHSGWPADPQHPSGHPKTKLPVEA